jgi:hypothetical protein
MGIPESVAGFKSSLPATFWRSAFPRICSFLIAANDDRHVRNGSPADSFKTIANLLPAAAPFGRSCQVERGFSRVGLRPAG